MPGLPLSLTHPFACDLRCPVVWVPAVESVKPGRKGSKKRSWSDRNASLVEKSGLLMGWLFGFSFFFFLFFPCPLLAPSATCMPSPNFSPLGRSSPVRPSGAPSGRSVASSFREATSLCKVIAEGKNAFNPFSQRARESNVPETSSFAPRNVLSLGLPLSPFKLWKSAPTASGN